MRAALVLLAVLASCKTSEKKAGTPGGPAVAARCDYVSKTVGENHSCHEVYAEAQVDALEKWCAKLQGPRDRGAFAKGATCPADGRQGGCLYPNGSVKWKYKGDISCIGIEFKDEPKRQVSTPYRCVNPNLCIETQSVYDLTKTVEATNCKNAGNTFEAGSCSTENLLARCNLSSHTADQFWAYYPPVTMEQARKTCADIEGTLVEGTPMSGSSGAAGSAGAAPSGATDNALGGGSAAN